MQDIITLDYGSGGQKTSELIEQLLLPAFQNPTLADLGDGAVLSGNQKLVFSTDSFVVSPWKFPGGDIGKLSVCGTVNDLCMAGGDPRYLSLSFILEEGFPVADLKTIIHSIAAEAKKAGVIIATGDTKVVERGKGDGIYINTSGIGFLRASLPGKSGIQKGDKILLSGTAGCHGAAVMYARTGLTQLTGDAALSAGAPSDLGNGTAASLTHTAFSAGSSPDLTLDAVASLTDADTSPTLRSDCALLTDLSAAILSCDGVRILRDPTRGGVATTLNEFVEHSNLSIELNEADIPVDPAVQSACDLLGLDPLYCACEGRMLAVVSPDQETAALQALRSTPGGEHAACIGTVTDAFPQSVVLKTQLGGTRLLQKLSGMQLPRIC